VITKIILYHKKLLQSVLNGAMPRDMTRKLAGVIKDEHYKQNVVEDLHAETTQLLERYFGNT
jgi:hypothetical protein